MDMNREQNCHQYFNLFNHCLIIGHWSMMCFSTLTWEKNHIIWFLWEANVVIEIVNNITMTIAFLTLIFHATSYMAFWNWMKSKQFSPIT
jgi:hypothetical protein